MRNRADAIRFHFLEKSFTLKDRTRLKQFIARLFTREGKPLLSLDYIFCSDAYLLQINREYLKHDFYTDIITFELSGSEEAAGEVYISIDRVRDNALQLGVSFKSEIHRVIFHGALHLCGYKDKIKVEKAEMRRKENNYLEMWK
jgi:probable rRNA maturation factor